MVGWKHTFHNSQKIPEGFLMVFKAQMSYSSMPPYKEKNNRSLSYSLQKHSKCNTVTEHPSPQEYLSKAWGIVRQLVFSSTVKD